MTCKVLVLYYSRNGNTRRMANQIARAADAVDGCETLVRTVAEIETTGKPPGTQVHAPIVSKSELRECDALIVGSPTRFGNMAAPLKAFFDSTSDLWLSGAMTDKPAAVFTSSSTMHGGQETTLFTMMLPMIHHGMIMIGIPYSEAALHRTQGGGTPYGASQVSGDNPMPTFTQDEKTLCSALGRRVATITTRLNAG
ncbi:MAG: NAD(P)H:quinone oxidoreductase [Pseudomonadota bacterium]